jgi:hypothetical protein
MIKAIETRYKGYRFRSRLEARWAVFFEALGLKWEYEPEGFATRAGWYLPDFYLPEMDMWVEVKPDQSAKKMHQDDMDKMLFFVFETRNSLLILDGTPAPKVYQIIVPQEICAQDCKGDWDPFGPACNTCSESGAARKTTETQRVCWYPKYLPPYNHDVKPRLYWQPYGGEEEDTPIHAINAARSARFEHGEVPA